MDTEKKSKFVSVSILYLSFYSKVNACLPSASKALIQPTERIHSFQFLLKHSAIKLKSLILFKVSVFPG